MSLDRLIEKIAEKQNPSVVGLDPFLPGLPAFLLGKAYAEYGETLQGAAAAALEFNRAVIDALCDVVPAVKPQIACYEQFGWPGLRALAETVRYAHRKGLFVILDGKRGDIGSTMKAYASGLLGTVTVGSKEIAPFDGDAMTVNGYLGTDGVEPVLEVCRRRDRGIFVLVKTSNPSSGELQDRPLAAAPPESALPGGTPSEGTPSEGTTLYRAVGGLCERWGAGCRGRYGYSGVGAVAGATYPEQLTELRAALPNTFFLVPGYGAQGGGAEGAARAFDRRGGGAVVNSSRAVLYAYRKEGCPPEQFAQAARREALRMRDALRAAVGPIRVGTE